MCGRPLTSCRLSCCGIAAMCNETIRIVEAHCHVVEREMGEFVSNSRGIESQ